MNSTAHEEGKKGDLQRDRDAAEYSRDCVAAAAERNQFKIREEACGRRERRILMHKKKQDGLTGRIFLDDTRVGSTNPMNFKRDQFLKIIFLLCFN